MYYKVTILFRPFGQIKMTFRWLALPKNAVLKCTCPSFRRANAMDIQLTTDGNSLDNENVAAHHVEMTAKSCE